MQAQPLNIMERLKEETLELHKAAEHHGFQQALFSGRLDREAYARFLDQMYLVFECLERELRLLIESRPEIGVLINDRHWRCADVAADLSHFGHSVEAIQPVDATTRLVTQIERLAERNRLALLGMHYVLEGANNGNRFIARTLQKTYDLTNGEGSRYLDPYGETQREVWQAYKVAMGNLSFTSEEADALVASAKAMFSGIYDISDAMTGTRV